MNIAKLVRAISPAPRDGLPSTQDLLQDPSTSYLKAITSPVHAEVDLVAVHGLNWANAPAFAVRTWTAGDMGEERLWLKDMLPHRLPHVRVLLYSYNSNVAFHTSQVVVGDIAEDLLRKLMKKRRGSLERPLVFVAHSLGGLVVKRAVVKARNNPEYSSISQSAKNFAFFATPHRGGYGAELGQAAAGLVRRLGMNPRNGIMEALRKDSHIAPEINSDFVDGQDNYRICSFFECKPMPGLSALIVERRSAILDLGRSETRIPCINANHSTICKFALEDESYREIIDEIESLVSWATSATNILKSNPVPLVQTSLSFSESDSSSESNSSLPDNAILDNDELSITRTVGPSRPPKSTRKVRRGPFFLVPLPQNLGFIGQRQVLHRLKEFATCPNSLYNKAALCGLGGIGKSQIALEHAFWYQMNNPDHSVFWIEARNPDQLQDSLGLIAAHCRISRPNDTRLDMLEQVRTWLLNPNNGSWLMIIDGADDMDTFNSALPTNSTNGTFVPMQALSSMPKLGYYIPAPAHGKLLFTTNNRSTAEFLASKGQVVEVKSMGRVDASLLLEKKLTEKTAHWSDEKSSQQIWHEDELQELAKKLDHIPLALVQAASYLRETSLSTVNYLELIGTNELELTKVLEQNPKAIDGDTDHISDAVMSTWTLAIEQMETQCRPAVEIFSLLVFFDSQRIPEVLLRNFQGFNGQMIAQSLRVLTAYAFITVGAQAETFDVHRLVQLAMYKRLSLLGLERKWAVRALTLLSQKFPDGNYKSWATCGILLPHATKILRFGLYGPAEASLVGALQSKMSWYFLTRGAFEQADILSQRALVNVGLVPGAKPEGVLAMKSERVIVLQKLGKYDEAENMAQAVWKEFESLLGPKHEDTLQSLSLLSFIYQEQGRYAAGEKVIRRILKSMGRSIEADDTQVLEARVRLEHILYYLGRYEEAEKHIDETVILYNKKFGHKHPGTLQAYYKLARVYYCQGRYERAEKLSFDTWTLQKEIIGADHPDTLKSLYELANNLQALHNFTLAESYKRDTYRSAIRLVGPSHRYTLLAASSLASCLLEGSLFENWSTSEVLAEVEGLYQLSLRGLEKDFRINHPMTLAARTDLCIARRLRSSAQLTELEAEEKDNLKKLKVILGDEHQLTVKSRENLSRILWAQQRGNTSIWKQALKHAKKVLEVREKRFGWFREGTIIREETLLAAKLVLEMLPEGKERQKLAQKVADMKSAHRFRESNGEHYDMGTSKDDGSV
ncbi:hypothetical protein MMC17_009936 [Xylographa soralifera]|nr:hypothetical protein [Xylographa soralifera]